MTTELIVWAFLLVLFVSLDITLVLILISLIKETWFDK